ncbi:VWA domain-containing protein [bacterium]|nr:VWA domain-containing protein [bacterium]
MAFDAPPQTESSFDADSIRNDHADEDVEFAAAGDGASDADLDDGVWFAEAAEGDSDERLLAVTACGSHEPETSPHGDSRGSVAGTLISVVLHVALLLNLAQLAIDQEPGWYEPPLEATIVDSLPDDEEELQSVEYVLADPDERELEVREVINAARIGLAATENPRRESSPQQMTELLPSPREQHVYDVPEGLEVDDRIVVNGTTGRELVQIDSALDLITWEIANNLQESRVLVVWLLDASGSLTEQRKAIARRLRRIYGELDALQQQTDQIPKMELPLLTGVVTFGEKTTFLTPQPTENFDDVQAAIQNVEIDQSGVENIFGAVKQVCSNWSRYRIQQRRRILLITVTDEAGDDFSESLEPAINVCQRFGAKAYVVGPTAVFGRRKGYVPYRAPEDGKTYQLPVDLGPESPVIESVVLPFWYAGPQFDNLSSGFAPYALARLVHETGGVYFTTNMTTMSGLTPTGVFDSATIKSFAPDYRFGTAEDYMRDLAKHPLRKAVVEASILSRSAQPPGTPQLYFAVTEGNFRQLATEAQKSAAKGQYLVEMILQAFPSGIEKELAHEDSARWRMNFCLTYGRLLAQRVRNLEYNYGLAWVKSNLANDDVSTKANRWTVKSSQKLNYAGTMKKTATLAEELLQRVVDEAPGTPWAVLAARELKDGFGIEIEQRYVAPPPPRPPAPRNAAVPKNKVQFVAEPKKPTPPPPKPPKPVLPKL